MADMTKLLYREQRGISKPESVVLDAIRSCAALMVFASHWTTYSGNEQKYHAVYSLGFPGVLIFFVLSGYLIAAATLKRETTASAYAVARIARLYSVAVPVLLLLPLMDAAMAVHYPSAVHQLSEASDPVRRIMVSLIFANWWWFAQVIPFTDGPYWSLSFEAAYYVIWGFYLFGGKWRWPGLILTSLIVGPKILLLLPIWLAGAILFRCGLRLTRLGAILAIPLAVLCLTLGRFHNVLPAAGWVEEASFPSHWLRGFGFCLALACALSLSPFQTNRFWRWLADRSFTIYLLHYPLLKYISVLLGPWSHTLPGEWLLALLALVICLAVGSIIEPTRLWWRATLTELWSHLQIGTRAIP
jgi:peptidoglycan/LPS O-acetylase OafA/YrhL